VASGLLFARKLNTEARDNLLLGLVTDPFVTGAFRRLHGKREESDEVCGAHLVRLEREHLSLHAGSVAVEAFVNVSLLEVAVDLVLSGHDVSP
jgi:hypothetical protein